MLVNRILELLENGYRVEFKDDTSLFAPVGRHICVRLSTHDMNVYRIVNLDDHREFRFAVTDEEVLLCVLDLLHMELEKAVRENA